MMRANNIKKKMIQAKVVSSGAGAILGTILPTTATIRLIIILQRHGRAGGIERERIARTLS